MSAQFKKPKGVRFVDMAIEVDRLIAIKDRELTDDEKNLIFEYLYHLAYMLATTKGLFKKAEYYDQFAIFLASSVYFRIFNTKIDEIDEETGEPKLTPIKSCLNYMKGILNPRRIDFEQRTYSQIYSQALDDDEHQVYDVNYTFADRLAESVEANENIEFYDCLCDIPKTIRHFLKRTPYKYGTAEWENIYLSCLLTLLNLVTLPVKKQEQFKSTGKSFYDNFDKATELVNRDSANMTIIYHLPDSMRDYIWILVQQIRHYIAKDLSVKTHTYIQSSDILNHIALAEINIETYTNYGDQ